MTIGIHKKQKQIQGGKIPSYLFFSYIIFYGPSLTCYNKYTKDPDR